MGALTGKNQVFKVRPWELQRFLSINFFDCLGLSIYIDLFGNKVIRILTNSLVFWLPDKIRFFYDSNDLNRLNYPIITFFLLKKKIKLLFLVQWTEIFDYFFSLKTLLKFFLVQNFFSKSLFTYSFSSSSDRLKNFYIFKYKNFLNFFINDDFDLYKAFCLKKLKFFINLNILNNFNFFNIMHTDYLGDFFLENLEQYKNLFLIYCNLRAEIPSLYYYFLKNSKLKLVSIFSFGYNIKFTVFGRNFGNNLKNFYFSKIKIFQNCVGTKQHSVFNDTLVLFGLILIQKYDSFTLISLIKKFFNFYNNIKYNYIFQNLVQYSLIYYDLHSLFRNQNKKYFLLSWYVNDNIFDNFNYIVNKYKFTIYSGHHIPIKFNYFDIFLPLEFGFEKKMSFLNIFNKVQSSEFLITPLNNLVRAFNDIIFLFVISLNGNSTKNFFIFELFNWFWSKKIYQNFFTFLDDVLQKFLIKLFTFYFFKFLLKTLLLTNLKFIFCQNYNNFYFFKFIIGCMFIQIFYVYRSEVNNFIFNYFSFELSSKYSLILNSKKNNFIKKYYLMA